MNNNISYIAISFILQEIDWFFPPLSRNLIGNPDTQEDLFKVKESELYAEIGNPESSFTYTQNSLYGASSGVV